MRWEKLFADLESQVSEDALVERDALIHDLREGERAATSWQQLCGGSVSIAAIGLGRADGEVVSGNEQMIHLRTAQAHLLINPSSVLEISHAERRAEPPSAVESRLGWAHTFRLCQRDRDRLTIIRVDSSRRVGVVAEVGRDYVSIRAESGGTAVIPFAAIAAVSCPR